MPVSEPATAMVPRPSEEDARGMAHCNVERRVEVQDRLPRWPHVHRLRRERLAFCCLREHVRCDVTGVLVWATLWPGGRHVVPTVRAQNLIF